METIAEYKQAFRELAEECRSKFGATEVEVSIYSNGDVKIIFE